ncbi:endonuclease VII domain-containing protein [Actinoplanes auranticolor]|nr:endonuclease VII domain-containing protein [Actinoplanes auranticolor]
MSDSGELDSVHCPQCGRDLPRSEFHSNRRRPNGLAYYCKRCAAERSEASRRRRGISARRQAPVPVPDGSKWCPDCETAKPLTAFARTRANASGYHSYCLLCHNARGNETRQRLYGAPDPQHVDHDHRTGWVRGILCFNCNGGLGRFRDNPVFLAEAITYLKGTTWQRVLIHPGVFQMCSPMRGRPPSRSS